MSDSFGPTWEADFAAVPPPDIGLPCDHARPCRFYRCKHHLAVTWERYAPSKAERRIWDGFKDGDMVPVVQFPELRVEDMAETCSLDVAATGQHSVAEVAAACGMDARHVHQILEDILVRIGVKVQA